MKQRRSQTQAAEPPFKERARSRAVPPSQNTRALLKSRKSNPSGERVCDIFRELHGGEGYPKLTQSNRRFSNVHL